MEDPEVGQDAIAEERDWFAAVETEPCATFFPRQKLPRPAPAPFGGRLHTPRRSLIQTLAGKQMRCRSQAGLRTACPSRDPAGRSRGRYAFSPEAFQPELSRFRELEERELPFRHSCRILERRHRDADKSNSPLDRK